MAHGLGVVQIWLGFGGIRAGFDRVRAEFDPVWMDSGRILPNLGRFGECSPIWAEFGHFLSDFTTITRVWQKLAKIRATVEMWRRVVA